MMEGDICPTEVFLESGEASTAASRLGLAQMLEHVATRGLKEIPSTWTHEASKDKKIFEFIKGDLRLFFFKGQGRQITVCTVGVMKKGQKADKASVSKSANMKSDYFDAAQSNTIEVIKDEDN